MRSDFPRIAGESSDTESAEHAENRPKLTFVSVFRKRDKVAADKENLQNVTVDDEKKSQSTETTEAEREEGQQGGQGQQGQGQQAGQGQAQKKEGQEEGEGVVYAELDLGAHAPRPPVVVRCDNDKTEYAEIIHSQPPK